MSRKAAPMSGNKPNAKFCIISIIPKPVPISLGLISLGIVGTITEQKRAMQIPSKQEGNHLRIDMDLREEEDSRIIIKR